MQRIDTRTSNFSRQLRLDLNRRGGYNDRYSADQVRSQLSQFESAVMQFRNRANSRQATASDARNVLQQDSERQRAQMPANAQRLRHVRQARGHTGYGRCAEADALRCSGGPGRERDLGCARRKRHGRG